MRILLGVLLLLPALAIAQKPSQRIGAFSVVPNADAMTDEDRSFALTIRVSGSSGLESLAWKCLADGLNVIIGTKYLAGDSDDEVRVTFRFAPDPASDPQYWGAMSGKEAWWMPMNLVASFTETARTKSDVMLRVVDPIDGETLTATFSLSGLGDALERLPCYRPQRSPETATER